MICTLKLYLNGVYFRSKEVLLSDNNPDLSSKENLEIRETELKSAAQIMRIENLRAIIKCQYQDEIAAFFQSKMNKYEHDFGRDEKSD